MIGRVNIVEEREISRAVIRRLPRYYRYLGELLENGVLSPVTILKTGHHGSKSASSEAFLEEVRPQAALISCGVNNRYHHPSEEVIQRFKKMDIQTKVTAQCGQITVKSDGKTYRLMQWQ